MRKGIFFFVASNLRLLNTGAEWNDNKVAVGFDRNSTPIMIVSTRQGTNYDYKCLENLQP